MESVSELYGLDSADKKILRNILNNPTFHHPLVIPIEKAKQWDNVMKSVSLNLIQMASVQQKIFLSIFFK